MAKSVSPWWLRSSPTNGWPASRPDPAARCRRRITQPQDRAPFGCMICQLTALLGSSHFMMPVDSVLDQACGRRLVGEKPSQSFARSGQYSCATDMLVFSDNVLFLLRIVDRPRLDPWLLYSLTWLLFYASSQMAMTLHAPPAEFTASGTPTCPPASLTRPPCAPPC